MGIKLVVIGAAGRMGKRILSLAAESGQFDVVAAVERAGHPDIGKNIGLATDAGPRYRAYRASTPQQPAAGLPTRLSSRVAGLGARLGQRPRVLLAKVGHRLRSRWTRLVVRIACALSRPGADGFEL